MPPVRPAQAGEIEYVLPPPFGGMNTRMYPTELPEDQFVMLKNVDPSEGVGAFVLRKDYGNYGNNNAVDIASPIRGGVRWYYSTSSKLLIVATASGKVYKGDDSDGSWTSLKTGLTTDKDVFFAAFDDRLFQVNGADAMGRYDGTTWKDAGFTAPGSTATVATGAAGVLTGDYQYKITFLYDSNSAHESSASSASATVSPSAQKVDLSSIPTGGTDCYARSIYRTKADGSEFFFVATISDNSTTTYTDNTADASLGTDQAPTDNGVPPAGQFIIFWRGRMVVARTTANPHRIFLSSLTNTERSPDGTSSLHGAGEEIFPSTHWIDVGDDNSPITGLATIQDYLVIFKQDQIWILQGDSARDMSLWKSQATTGCIAPKTITTQHGIVYFLGRNEGLPNVYMFDGAKTDPISLDIEEHLNDNIYALGDTATQAVQPCATQYRGLIILSYAKSSGGYDMAIYDTRPPKPRWMIFDDSANALDASIFIPWFGTGDAGELYYGQGSESKVFRFAHPTNQRLQQMTIKTKWMDLGRPYQRKQFKWIEIYGKYLKPDACAYETITVTRFYDFNTSGTTAGSSGVNIDKAITGHDIFKLRINCEGQDGSTEEHGYVLQLQLLVEHAEIYKVVIKAYAFEPWEMTKIDTLPSS